jgi:hypothetical protein
MAGSCSIGKRGHAAAAAHAAGSSPAAVSPGRRCCCWRLVRRARSSRASASISTRTRPGPASRTPRRCTRSCPRATATCGWGRRRGWCASTGSAWPPSIRSAARHGRAHRARPARGEGRRALDRHLRARPGAPGGGTRGPAARRSLARGVRAGPAGDPRQHHLGGQPRGRGPLPAGRASSAGQQRGLPDPNTHALALGPDGGVWAGHRGGPRALERPRLGCGAPRAAGARRGRAAGRARRHAVGRDPRRGAVAPAPGGVAALHRRGRAGLEPGERSPPRPRRPPVGGHHGGPPRRARRHPGLAGRRSLQGLSPAEEGLRRSHRGPGRGSEGGLWIGTELCGLHRVADRPFRTLTPRTGCPAIASWA